MPGLSQGGGRCLRTASYRRRKLHSWRLAIVGRISEKSKGKVNVGGKLYYFKGEARQPGRGWVIGEKAVGKNNNSD